jgi:chemotaxis protein CheY-P-specific phosphatase CheC
MDLQSRKLEFIKEFLKIQSEEAIERLEKLLKIEQEASTGQTDSMSEEELNLRIAQSERDFKNNRFKTSQELLAKYK